ncbi:MAG: preprotein translocase subunit SecB [Gammaproteobacteria bacterium]|jgi:preprotein translocase subunit SecB
MTEEKNQPGPQFDLEKIYLKDISFESPNTPAVFMQKDFNPKVDINLDVEHQVMPAENYYEVTLTVEVRAKIGEKNAFLVSVQQAGIFRLQNFPEKQIPTMLAVACPNTLMPFIRETVADLVTKGGYPQLLLAPVNFDLLYAKKQQEKTQSEGETTH